MTKKDQKQHRFKSMVEDIYYNVILPFLDGAANQFSPQDARVLVPTAVQSTSYYLERIDRNRL